MILDVKFTENVASFETDFGVVHHVSDGGYERGYDEGYRVGFAAGVEDGRTAGYNDGYSIGLAEGKDIGYVQGYNEGYSVGYEQGYAKGKADGYAEGFEDGKAEGGASEPIILTPSVTLENTCAIGGDYESGKTITNGSWAYETNGYTVYGYALHGCKKLKFSGAWLHNTFSTGTVRENILFVKGFANEGGGVGVIGSSDIEVEPETYDVDNFTPYECVITVPSDADGVYFSCADKLSPTVEVIEQITPEEAYNSGYAEGYDDGYDEGVAKGNDVFWDTYQSNGARTNYKYAFNFNGWKEANFKPKYNIIPTGEVTQMFYTSDINADLVEICEKQGIVIDFSKITQLEYVFQNSSFTRVGVIDASKATKFVSVFNGAKKLVTIDKLMISNKCTTITTPFSNCIALENITIEGEIAKNGFNLSASTKLSRESIESIINALSTTTSELTVTFSTTAVNAAIEVAEPGCNTTNSGWWAWLIGTKPNWTISLV